MTQNNPGTHNPGIGKKKRNPWVLTLKIAGWSVLGLAILCGIAIWIIASYLSPERVARLIEEKSGEYLEANVKIGHLDYKLFSTYPWLDFEVDTLEVISKTLDGVAGLPENADSLAFVRKLKGKVNVHDLLRERLKLRDLEIEKPRVNILIVNDSLNNFNIAKEKISLPDKDMPDIDMKGLKIIGPVELNFSQLQQDIAAGVEIERMNLEIQNKDFLIAFEGLVDGHYGDIALPGKVPVKFNTGLNMRFPEMEIKLTDMFIALAGVSLEAKGDITINDSNYHISKADIKAEIEDIFELMQYIPPQLMEKVQIPEGLDGYLPMQAHLTLREPYEFTPEKIENLTLESLPSLMAGIYVEDANLRYSPPKGKEIYADDIYLSAAINYDPKDADANTLIINELRMNGEGISLSATARLDNLTGEEQPVSASLNFGSTLIESLSYLLPSSGKMLAGHIEGNLTATATIINFGRDGVKDISVSGGLESRKLNVAPGSSGTYGLKNFKGSYDARIPAYPLKDYAGTKLKFELEADSITSRTSGLTLLISDFDTRLDAIDTVSGNPDPSGVLMLNIGKMTARQGASNFSARDINLRAEGSLNSNSPSYNGVPLNLNDNSCIIESRIDHTPLELEYDGGGILSTIMTMMNLDLKIRVAESEFKTPDYLYPVEVRGLSMKSNMDNVAFDISDIVVGRTSLSLNGNFNGLKPFLVSYSPTLLKADADISCNDVDINQLAWGYYGAQIAQGKKNVYEIPPLKPYTAADSVCVVIPRNIEANLRIQSKSAQYMGYTFSPLSTQILVNNGDATLKNLSIGTPYCSATVDWTYSTRELDNIYMSLNADIKNFKFAPFYKVFPNLISKSPELENLTGVINASLGCRFNMFPSMFLNPESLKGNFSITGSDLQFARQGKIEKITHLMLIHGDTPISLETLRITGAYHDNLLQINPFKVEFDDYQLEIAGVNNTAGRMYYHFALEKSPFHLPFGVSVSGDMKHPEVKLGGTRIDDYKAEAVSLSETNKIDVNIMAELHHGWLLFLQQAAKFEENEE